MLKRDPLTKMFLVHGETVACYEDGSTSPNGDGNQTTDIYFAYGGRMFKIARSEHLAPDQYHKEVDDVRAVMDEFKTEVECLPDDADGNPWDVETIKALGEITGFWREDNAMLRRAITRIATAAREDGESKLAKLVLDVMSGEIECLKT